MFVLPKRHPSGVSDNAYAYNNLRDMCSPGGKAARSSYSCNVCRSGTPGGSVCLSIALLEYLVELQDSGTVIVSSWKRVHSSKVPMPLYE
nr:hypothetical protein BaRGS_021136 [Batillaria attramentaria]